MEESSGKDDAWDGEEVAMVQGSRAVWDPYLSFVADKL